MTILRPSVQRFAEAMERQLCLNDHKGGWSDMRDEELLARVKEETTELEDAVLKPWWYYDPEVLNETADVANFAMFIADNHGCLDKDWGVGR